MLVFSRKNNMIINLDRVDVIRTAGKKVEAIKGLGTIKIAECESENDAQALQEAISNAWLYPRPYFDMDEWFHWNMPETK